MPRAYYHVSKEDLGEIVTFVPNVPGSALVSKEGNIPRISVAPTVIQCIFGLCGGGRIDAWDVLSLQLTTSGLNNNPLVVYSTNDVPYLPPNVSDFRKTEEHWFLEPTQFHRVGYISWRSLTRGEIKVISKKKKRMTEFTEPTHDVPLKMPRWLKKLYSQ